MSVRPTSASYRRLRTYLIYYLLMVACEHHKSSAHKFPYCTIHLVRPSNNK